MGILGIDHVQLAMPAGGERQAREFYGGLLGMPEVAKPEALAGRGGVWFENGTVKLHLGVDPRFHPASKAHPALLVSALPALLRRLQEAGVEVVHGEALPGYHRAFVADPFGNRLELMERAA